jgi:hypothetical protein
VAETVDRAAVSVPDAVRAAHPEGIDILIDLASDADESPSSPRSFDQVAPP